MKDDIMKLATKKQISKWRRSDEYDALTKADPFSGVLDGNPTTFGLVENDANRQKIGILWDDLDSVKSEWARIEEGGDFCVVSGAWNNAEDTTREDRSIARGSIEFYRIAVCSYEELSAQR